MISSQRGWGVMELAIPLCWLHNVQKARLLDKRLNTMPRSIG